jgi:hypothetical protein
MEAIAETLEHRVIIPKKKEKPPEIDWEKIAVLKQLNGVDIFTHPAIPIKPDNPFAIDPCDLSQIFTDYSEWERFPANKGSAPFAGGPRRQATERITRFNARITKDDFKALLRILGLDLDRSPDEKWQEWYDKGYAVIYHEALHPKTAGYLTQMRVISEVVLPDKFHTLKARSSMTRQPIPRDEALWLFVEDEKKKWDWRSGGQKLDGVFADAHGWNAYLRFGIMKEDGWGSVVRIFSDVYLRSSDTGCWD